ncbi:MAG TPA: right-handed parallel beta-helix repeat-containing protein [bacterium]|nr:right-handed parallel beta-helix repeat-containing protein [bacterium]
MRTRGLFFAMMALLSLGACSEKSTTPNDEAATGDVDVAGDQLLSDADTYDFWKDGPQRPHPVDWGTCPEGWEPKETKDEEGNLLAKYCEPPLNWRPAAPVDWGTCPEGWEPMEEKDEDGNLLAKYCEPILPPDGTECEPGYFTMFGSVDCQRIGDECPDGEFADIPTDAGTEIVYVFEGDSIQAAIDAAKDGAVIAIGKGTFDEFVTITDKNITLWGACVEGTILSPTTPMSDGAVDAIIRIDGTDPEKKVVVKNLTLTGGQRRGINLSKISADVLNTAIMGTKRQGVAINGHGKLLLSSCIIKDTIASDDHTRGQGISIWNSDVNIIRGVFERNKNSGIIALSDAGELSSITGTDLIVRNTQAQESDDLWGEGISTTGGVSFVGERVLLENNRDAGFFAATASSNDQGHLIAQYLIVRDTQPQKKDGTGGIGIMAQDTVTVEISKALLERNRTSGFYAVTREIAGSHGQVELTDIIVRDTIYQESDKNNGKGINFQDNISAKAERVLLSDNREVGFFAGTFTEGAKGDIDIVDLVVIGTKEQESDKKFGRGVVVKDNMSALLARIVVERNWDIGILASTSDDAEGTFVVSDVVVRDTGSQKSDGMMGRGISLTDNIAADLKRVLSERSRHVGLLAGTSSSSNYAHFIGADLVVRDTLPQENDKSGGRGVAFQGNFKANISRVLVKENREMGLGAGSFSVEDQGEIVATDIIVIDTEAQESDLRWGNGIAFQDVMATITNALVDNNREMGVYITRAEHETSEAYFTNVTISDTRVRECYEQDLPCNYLPEIPWGHGLGVYAGDPAHNIHELS